MRKIYLFTVLMGFFALCQAQTFHVTPANTVNTTVDINHSVEVYIHFTNNFQTGIDLVWETTNSVYPSNWFMSVCDNKSCYTLPHLRDSMATVSAQDSGFLKVQCVPNGTVGSGTLTFHVYDMNSPVSSANVTFNFEATEVVAVTNAQLEEQFTISPNPANDFVRLSARGSQLDKGKIALMDLRGQIVSTQEVNAVQSADVRVADLAPGIYMLRYESKNGTMTKKVVVAH